jgi:hypothetical protein
MEEVVFCIVSTQRTTHASHAINPNLSNATHASPGILPKVPCKDIHVRVAESRGRSLSIAASISLNGGDVSALMIYY